MHKASGPGQVALGELIKITQQGFWYVDTEGLTLDVNPAMCHILGRPHEEILGKSIYDFVDDENAEIFRKEIGFRGLI